MYREIRIIRKRILKKDWKKNRRETEKWKRMKKKGVEENGSSMVGRQQDSYISFPFLPMVCARAAFLLRLRCRGGRLPYNPLSRLCPPGDCFTEPRISYFASVALSSALRQRSLETSVSLGCFCYCWSKAFISSRNICCRGGGRQWATGIDILRKKIFASDPFSQTMEPYVRIISGSLFKPFLSYDWY